MVDQVDISTTKSGYIEITKSPLVVTIQGGTSRTVTPDRSFIINATTSVDPDHETATFLYFCKRQYEDLPFDEDCLSPPGSITYSEDGSVLTVPPNVVSIGDKITFRVDVTESDRQASAEVVVDVVAPGNIDVELMYVYMQII